MLNSKKWVGLMFVGVCIAGLNACQKHENPFLKDVKASAKLVNGAWAKTQPAFYAIDNMATMDACFLSEQARSKTYGVKVSQYNNVCTTFLHTILSQAHNNPLFKSATLSDLRSLTFYQAYSKERNREFMQ
jgi:hypothetical protein